MNGKHRASVPEAVENKSIYWHRELPPANAEILGEHTVEATSRRVSDTLAHRNELWEQCYDDLMNHARERLEQEIARLGGECAHVLDEFVDSRHASPLPRNRDGANLV